MFVEPEPGSGFDKVAPAAIARGAIRWLLARAGRAGAPDAGHDQAAARQQGTDVPHDVRHPVPPDR